MTVGRLRDLLVRFTIVWFIVAGCLYLAQILLPGLSIRSTENASAFTVALSAALLLGMVNIFIRPIIILLTLPINTLTLGLPVLVIDALMLYLVSQVMPGFHVDNFGVAFIAALVLAVANTITLQLTTIDDDESFFQLVVKRLARRQKPATPLQGRGLVFLEIDGLSYGRMKRAMEEGIMPSIQELIDRGSHLLSYFDCGLPSQTSASQAGILYGRNDDIPAFRWYDKRRNRMIVSNHFHDAFEIDRRFAGGNGLLRGGASINNLFAGDAAETLLTMSTLSAESEYDRSRRTQDLYLFWLNPYIFIRSMVLTIADILLEFAQNIRQQIRDEKPRMNRLRHGYPILRGITNVMLRDLSTCIVTQDIIRGVPAIYTTFVGYDEVSHFAGPDSPDAFRTLRSYDAHVRRIVKVIEQDAGRPYDLFLLSDHGQSAGWSFRQRYGETLAALVSRLAAGAGAVAAGTEGQAGARYVLALASEFRAAGERAARGTVGRAAMRGAHRALTRSARQAERPPLVEIREPIVVACSGNFANVYFRFSPERVCLDSLDVTYPGLVEGLIHHAGIGFVVGYLTPDHPLVFGKNGARDLLTGQVTGDDPLDPFGDPDIRAGQVLRVARFPSAGDLLINSALYPDGQVASFEEQVGSHGGLGGPQTEAFIVHPVDLPFDPTRLLNSADIFPLLDSRRDLPGEPIHPQPRPVPAEPAVDTFSWDNLWPGMRNVRQIWRRAWKALVLNQQTYAEIARDSTATGQGMIVLAITLFIESLVETLTSRTGPDPRVFAGHLFSALVGFLVLVWLAYRITQAILGRDSRRADFARTFRTLAFATTPSTLTLLGLLPGIGTLFLFVGDFLGLVATFFALRSALRLPWWHAIALPFFGLMAFSVVSFAVLLIVQSTTLTAQVLLQLLGVLH